MFLNRIDCEWNDQNQQYCYTEIPPCLIKRISEVIEKNGYAEGQINEIIDKALALAAFEIATNPNTYEELIISEDTISDNSKYKLIKRKK